MSGQIVAPSPIAPVASQRLTPFDEFEPIPRGVAKPREATASHRHFEFLDPVGKPDPSGFQPNLFDVQVVHGKADVSAASFLRFARIDREGNLTRVEFGPTVREDVRRSQAENIAVELYGVVEPIDGDGDVIAASDATCPFSGCLRLIRAMPEGTTRSRLRIPRSTLRRRGTSPPAVLGQPGVGLKKRGTLGRTGRMPLALLFDIDGTLLDTLDSILDSMNAACRELGVAPPFTVDELRPMIGTPVQRQLHELRNVEGPLADRFTDRYYAHFTRRVDAGVRVYPGVRETFPGLAGRRITTMSTRRRSEAEHMLQVSGLAQYFTTIVGGDQVPRPKPSPDLPRFGADSLRVPADHCIVVGDSPVDIAAGRAAGMRTIAALYGYGGGEALREQGPDGTIARFSELPTALGTLDEVVA